MKKETQDQPTNAIVHHTLNYQEIAQIGKAFVASGMFGRDMDKISKAITKIMAGQELGLTPFAAMRAINVIDGSPTLSANTMGGMVKRSDRYDYEVDEKDGEICKISFYEIREGKRVKLGTETFDLDEAKQANLLHKNNWKNYPKAMLFARCLSNGVRTYCPDVFSGLLVYTPDELGKETSESGEIIDINPKTGEVETKNEKQQKPKQDDASDNSSQDQRPDEADVNEDKPADKKSEFKKEAKPEVKLDDVKTKLESIGLTSTAKIRLIKEHTGHVAFAAIKKQEEIEALNDAVEAILNNEVEVDKGDLQK